MSASSSGSNYKRSYHQHNEDKLSKYSSCKAVKSVKELLYTYPQLCFDPNDPDSIDLWKDLLRIASPEGQKKDLQYDPDHLCELIEQELHHLVDLQHILVRALKQLGDNCTKVELLKLVTKMSGVSSPYCLGGGSRCDTRRLIVMYEVEADVAVKKRKCGKRTVNVSSPAHPCTSNSSTCSSSSACAVAPLKRAHSLSYGDSLDENIKIVTGMSLKHLFDDFDLQEVEDSMYKLKCSNSLESMVLAPAAKEEEWQNTQEIFDDLMSNIHTEYMDLSQSKN